nr:permease-like cell division protein FtsX [Thorsellia anophelis]
MMQSGLMEQFLYGWRSAFEDMRSKPLANLLTILVISISLSLPTLCYLLWKNVNEAAQAWYPTPQISVYLDKSLSDPGVEQLIMNLNALDGVANVNYLTREKTLEEFKNYSGFSTAIDLLEENPLPAVAIVTPEVDFQSGTLITTLKERIVALEGVDDVRADDNWFARLASLTNLVAKVAFVVGWLMVIALFLVIGNSVRLTIASRRETINIMKLIGATDGFIMRPFLYGGALYGGLGALLAILLSQLLMVQLDKAVTNVAVVFEANFSLTGLRIDEMLILVFISVMSGWFAAWLATVKHLRDFRPQ